MNFQNSVWLFNIIAELILNIPLSVFVLNNLNSVLILNNLNSLLILSIQNFVLITVWTSNFSIDPELPVFCINSEHPKFCFNSELPTYVLILNIPIVYSLWKSKFCINSELPTSVLILNIQLPPNFFIISERAEFCINLQHPECCCTEPEFPISSLKPCPQFIVLWSRILSDKQLFGWHKRHSSTELYNIMQKCKSIHYEERTSPECKSWWKGQRMLVAITIYYYFSFMEFVIRKMLHMCS